MLVLFNIIVLFIIIFLLRKSFFYPYKVSKENRVVAIFFMILFCVFTFWSGDYWHTLNVYSLLQKGWETHYEDIYIYIAKICPSYWMFRLVVWGICIMLITLTYKRLNINYDLSLCIFGLTYLIWISYARASLAMAFMFFGVSFWFKPINKKKVLSFIIGLLFVGSSYYFHDSSIFGILICIGSFLVYRNFKYFIFILLLIYPILIYKTQDILVMIMTQDEPTIDAISESQYYLSGEERVRGLGELLGLISYLVPYYIILIVYTKIIRQSIYKFLPNDIKGFMTLTISIILISTIFLFDLKMNTSVIYYRFLNFAMIPSVVFISYCKEHHICVKLINIVILLYMFSSFYSLIYSLYCKIIV